MEWIVIEKDGLPPEGEEVFFDGGENPPVWGKIKYNGKLPDIVVQDSSGEEDFLPVSDYERWLDERQPSLTIQQGVDIWDAAVEYMSTTFDRGKLPPDKAAYFASFGFDIDKLK